jgi:DeoR/GlpR family transcriptional regulator of sugar metabolism
MSLMLIPERQSRLRELLARRGMSDLDSLAAELRVSQSTVRRDVEAARAARLVQRTHGGVIWVGDADAPGARPTRSTSAWATSSSQARHRQAARAARPPGETILIDGGTTTFYLAEELLGQPLQIVTNSLPIANLFTNDERRADPHRRRHLPALRRAARPDRRSGLATIHTQTMFFSVAGVHDGSLYNQNLLLVQSERR